MRIMRGKETTAVRPEGRAEAAPDGAPLDAAVAKLRTDYDVLLEDSRDLALEAARALAAAAAELARALADRGKRQVGKAAAEAWDEIRERPVTAAAIAVAGASTALAAALSRGLGQPKPPAPQ